MKPYRTAFVFVALLLTLPREAQAWGRDGHRFINRNAVYYLPGQMLVFVQDSALFIQHASDADSRSGSPGYPDEAPKHYIDIDDYPDYLNLPHSMDSVVSLYGLTRVIDNGTNPWATLWVYDSLVAQLKRGAWDLIPLTASDLGHYVGDGHQPLHATKNYNGQLSGNSGIHSRYESSMINSTYYLSSLYVTPHGVEYIQDKSTYIFDYLFHSLSVADTILHGDTQARIASGWNGSGTAPAAYYAALWSYTSAVTLDQMQHATQDLANLWFSAWVDAGLISTTGIFSDVMTTPTDFQLAQNYPNPFNPSTVITYTLPAGGSASLTVYSANGEEVAVLVQGFQSPGVHAVRFDASDYATGVYFYTLRFGDRANTRKALLVR